MVRSLFEQLILGDREIYSVFVSGHLGQMGLCSKIMCDQEFYKLADNDSLDDDLDQGFSNDVLMFIKSKITRYSFSGCTDFHNRNSDQCNILQYKHDIVQYNTIICLLHWLFLTDIGFYNQVLLRANFTFEVALELIFYRCMGNLYSCYKKTPNNETAIIKNMLKISIVIACMNSKMLNNIVNDKVGRFDFKTTNLLVSVNGRLSSKTIRSKTQKIRVSKHCSLSVMKLLKTELIGRLKGIKLYCMDKLGIKSKNQNNNQKFYQLIEKSGAVCGNEGLYSAIFSQNSENGRRRAINAFLESVIRYQQQNNVQYQQLQDTQFRRGEYIQYEKPKSVFSEVREDLDKCKTVWQQYDELEFDVLCLFLSLGIVLLRVSRTFLGIENKYVQDKCNVIFKELKLGRGKRVLEEGVSSMS